MSSDEFDESDLDNVARCNARWRHRRRLTYIAFFSIIAFVLMSFFFVPVGGSPAWEILKLVINGLFLVVLAYMGLSTVDDNSMKYLNDRKDVMLKDTIGDVDEHYRRRKNYDGDMR